MRFDEMVNAARRDMIRSATSPRIRRIEALMRRRRDRQAEGLFVLEGVRLCQDAPAGSVAEVYVSRAYMESAEKEAGAALESLRQRTAEGAQLYIIENSLMERLSDTATPQGILCLGRMPAQVSAERFLDAMGDSPLLLGLEAVRDPGNLGTILRTAEAAGVNGIVLTGDCVDRYSPKVVRSTMSSIFRVKVLELAAEDEAAFDALCRARGITQAASVLEDSVDYDAADLTGPVIIWVGNEARGLTERRIGESKIRIRIPMQGQIESLNAGIAAGLLVYEAARQRRHVR